MKGYVAKKRCTIGGVVYNVGDPIPFDAVMPSRVGSLKAANIIAEVNIPETGDVETSDYIAQIQDNISSNITIPIIKDGETMQITLSPEEIAEGVRILQVSVEELEKAVKDIDNMDLLIFVDRLETRKTAKQAIKERAERLMAPEEQNDGSQQSEGIDEAGKGDA